MFKIFENKGLLKKLALIKLNKNVIKNKRNYASNLFIYFNLKT